MSRIRSRAIRNIFIVIFLVSGSGCTLSPAHQQGSIYKSFWEEHKSKVDEYRLPKGDDLSYWGKNENTYFYKSTDNEGKTKAPYWTKGDFNADQIIDLAYLLFSKKDGSAVVIVFLSDLSLDYRAVELASATKYMGVSTETLNINVSGEVRDLIKLFEFEGHGALYIWDSSSNSFQKQS